MPYGAKSQQRGTVGTLVVGHCMVLTLMQVKFIQDHHRQLWHKDMAHEKCMALGYANLSCVSTSTMTRVKPVLSEPECNSQRAS